MVGQPPKKGKKGATEQLKSMTQFEEGTPFFQWAASWILFTINMELKHKVHQMEIPLEMRLGSYVNLSRLGPPK